jgi:hypothetical protein
MDNIYKGKHAVCILPSRVVASHTCLLFGMSEKKCSNIGTMVYGGRYWEIRSEREIECVNLLRGHTASTRDQVSESHNLYGAAFSFWGMFAWDCEILT